MTLEQIRDLIVLISGEKGHEVSYGPEEFCDVLHLAQLKYFKTKIGLPEDYSPGMPLPPQAYELTQRLTEDIRPFKVSKGWLLSSPLYLDSTKGTLAYPSDYYIISALSYFYAHSSGSLEREIKVLSDLEYSKCTTSILEKPDKFFPVCNMQADFIRFSPILTEAINFSYLRLPVKPFWKVIDNDGFYEYDDENSVNLEWDSMAIIDIIVLFLSEIGIALNNQNVVQYAQNVKKEGV